MQGRRVIAQGSSANARNRSASKSNAMYNNEKYNSTEWLHLTSLSDSGGDAATSVNNKKISNLLANLPEDMRISKLLRQLGTEKDGEVAKNLCAKLNVVVVDASNAIYIRRSFDILADTMMRIFKEGPLEALPEIAEVFGRMGWVVRSDFSIYRSWIQRMYKVERIREWIMKAVEHTLKIDSQYCELRAENCSRLIDTLKDYLENTEKSAHFIAITNTIQQFAQNYPKQFQPHFADIVDIVIGWHLEIEQSILIKNHCSYILQNLKPFWLNDVTFTRNLLSQFLEDIISYREEIQQNLKGATKLRDKDSSAPEICFGSIVGATNSILKCIYNSSAALCQHIEIDLLNNIFNNVLQIMQLIITNKLSNQFSVEQNNIICVCVNELIVIILDCQKYGLDVCEEILINLVLLQLKSLEIESDVNRKVTTVLFVVYKLIAELKTKLPLSFVEEIFSIDEMSNIHQLKFSRNAKTQKAMIRIYQKILNLKNVEMLQTAYKLILSDFMEALQALQQRDKTIASDENAMQVDPPTKYSVSQAEYLVGFYLSTISSLAIAHSSIIVMWALQPTLLEMLTDSVETAAYDKFWMTSPETHYAILSLLKSHCCNNNHFISSSALLHMETNKITETFTKLNLDDTAGEFVPGASSFQLPAKSHSSESSPTALHYELILKFLEKILGQRKLTERHLYLLLEWCESLIKQSVPYSRVLSKSNEFTHIVEIITRISVIPTTSVLIPLKCADCIDSLYKYDSVHPTTLQTIAETSCIQMCSNAAVIREHYSHIFAKLPLNVSLKQVNQFTGAAKIRARQINTVQHWYWRTPIHQKGGEMRTQLFPDFIRAIKICDKNDNENSKNLVENILINIFVHCWCLNNDADSKMISTEAIDFQKMALSDMRVLVSWAEWEAAQYCVNNKLRTILGKPQETFLKIESIIKEDARILAMKDKSTVPNVDTILNNQRHARIMLGFMEALEKSIYNASEGTAVALPPAEKPARTFFHVNAVTCNEWFNRIRTAVDLVALHCMEPEMVLRYTENVLKSLVSNAKTSEPLFEHTLMSHAWALLRNGESDALHGLFTWSKAKTNKKFIWIKMAAGKLKLFFSIQLANLRLLFSFIFRTSRWTLRSGCKRLQKYTGLI